VWGPISERSNDVPPELQALRRIDCVPNSARQNDDLPWVEVNNGYVQRNAIIHVWIGAPPVGDLLPRANR
jgi:hypothetical protein